ncbi:sarcoma antigen ny-sar-23 [Holotrichia oblita]|uniref:Sarcoma antigen ny-sar-23 n=1 Tax=Holotrichia oblita TaxID=644536 RepID=A0ACB9SIU4_HOLOL|nr:sarcoma antigen ny-sar-23 [Holotrichia oblita]
MAAYPGLIVMNSCLWDITRYGPSSIAEFKLNFIQMLQFVKENLPRTKMVWITTLPPSPKCRGGFLNAQARFLQTMLPFHVVQANDFVTKTLKSYNVDIIDLHYHMKFLIDYRANDGIHWNPEAVRFITNLFLTHLTVSNGLNLPGRVLIGGKYALYNRLRSNRCTNQNGTQKKCASP